MTLKLEVGKYYRRRDGEKVKIVKEYSGSCSYPFTADNSLIYTRHGKYCLSTHTKDLIAEWTEPSSSPISPVTKKVITSGTYGNLSIVTPNECGIGVHLGWTYGADNIRQMAALLNEIADVIEENEK